MGPISKGTTLVAGIHFVALGAPSLALAQAAPSPSSAPALSPPACAGGVDVIDQKDGGMFRGTIIDAIPNGNARIVLVTGEIVTIPWQDIAKIERCSAPPPATPPASAAAAPAPSPADSKSSVWVHMEGSKTGLIEQDEAGFNRKWEPVCKAACDKALSPAYSYRIVGDGIRNSTAFTLSAHAGQREVLAVSEGSTGGFVLGIIGTAGGGAALLTGLLIVVLGQLAKSADQTEDPYNVADDNQLITAGWVTAAIGGAVLLGGIALTISNAGTHVSQEVAATPAQAPTPSRRWAKISVLSDTRRDTATALPPMRGIPLFGGRF